ncbi:MAG: hypothetical protein IPH32_15420 [Bacteroidetes bacterium]|nr:hypothetical protein [Bacteroidota bacterium]
MRLKLAVIITFFLFANLAYCQDVLYTTAGSKLKGKVTEINTKDIKYKDFNNLEGPTYVIAKADVVLIQYSNGTTDVINDNPNTLAPKPTATVAPIEKPTEKPASKPFDKNDPYAKGKKGEKKEYNLYYLNSNMISINALALANGDVTVMYDRDLFQGKMSLSFLGGYSFNRRMGGLNLFIADAKDGAKKKYDAGFGINYMPRNTKRVQYFVGVLAKYMAYDYLNVVDTTNNQKSYQKESGYQLGILVTNGWVFRVTPNFNFKIFGSVGGQINSTPLEVTNSSGTRNYGNYPKIYLGYCFGYRF